jgi:hypothetical protein
MAAQRTASTRKGAGQRKPALPPVTVAKLEETGKLIERLLDENQSLFIRKGQAYKDAHREGTSRHLTAIESAHIAKLIAEDGQDVLRLAEEVQASSASVYDEPDQREILLATGAAVAPAFLEAVRRVVALIEMPADQFEAACEEDRLTDAIEVAAVQLRKLELSQARARASAAFAHYAKSAGFESGEVLSLPVQAVWQALTSAMSHLMDDKDSSQLIDSAASTDGPDELSSTTSDGPKPSS